MGGGGDLGSENRNLPFGCSILSLVSKVGENHPTPHKLHPLIVDGARGRKVGVGAEVFNSRGV